MSTSNANSFHHGDLKSTLARSAFDLVSVKGLEGFSLREVARHANVSTAAPYRHFENKDALLAEVAREGFHLLRQAMLSAPSLKMSPLDKLLRQADAYFEFAIANPTVYRLMFGSHLEKSAYPELENAGDQLFEVLESHLLNIPANRRAPYATGCWSLIHGASTLAIDGQLQRHSANKPDLSTVLRPFVQPIFPSET